MNILILLSLSFALETSNTEDFTIHGKKITFYNYPEHRITVSPACPDLKKDVKCKNIEFLSKIRMSDVASKIVGGVNEGSLLCNEALNGIIVIGYDQNKNENSFCKIKDLYIDSGTISYYAHKNTK